MIYRGGGKADIRSPHRLETDHDVAVAPAHTSLNVIRGLLILSAFGTAGLIYSFYNVHAIDSSIAAVRNDWVNIQDLSDDDGLPPLPEITHQSFFDIEIDDEYIGRVVMGLFGKNTPKTVDNFYKLCTGEMGPKLHYSGMRFHRVVPGFIVQGGDIVNGDGTGAISIYGYEFADEKDGLALKHDRKYLLQMANSGPNTNGCQFCFMLNPAPHLNGHHMVFGRVLSGHNIIDKMGLLGNDEERPTKKIVVVESGAVLPPDEKLKRINTIKKL
uniref:Peptidyl-prolyl cis-trans isomerase n=1 Tax=Spongospora subterranea TaxID=70186 RepID=A0A0H5R5N5_9EUKA|eukprot:CRZ09470.1 hypothetical protein [Spongospora subterranea]